MPSTEIWYLENIIDYAGTFPPAALPSVESWKNYLGYRSGEESWIVGSLAWSVSTLDDLAGLTRDGDDVELALIGRPSNSWDTWLEAREQDLAQMKKVFAGGKGLAAATYESRIADLDQIGEAMQRLKPIAKETDIYVELPWDKPLEDALAEVASHEWARAKFRTGGLMKESFPSCDQLASIIKQCVDLEVEFKLTAGLHEPIGHNDEATGAYAHGFLNVLAATAIAFADDASTEEISQILSISDASQWRIGESLSVAGRTFGEDELNDARSFFGSFGSCSIDEPLAGLGRLSRG